MKRPLLAVCLTITCVIALWYRFYPPPLSEHVPEGTAECMIYGRIERKENRSYYGKEQLILYLTDYTVFSEKNSNYFSSSAQLSVQEQSAKQEITQPRDLTCRTWQKNGRTGKKVVCYVNIGPEKTAQETQKEEASQKEEVSQKEEASQKTGSFILLRGKPEDFNRPGNPGEFDSRLYYASQGIDFCVKNGEVLWESDSYSAFRETLWELRRTLEKKIDSALGAEAASVMKTMLLGNRQELDKEIKALYQAGGIAHILAISGLHISLIGMGFYRLLRKGSLPIWFSALTAGMCIWVYGIFTGAGVSAKRAVGMFLIRMLAEILGRGYDMLTALGVLLLFLVLQQPLYLYHSGFLLSFSALFGIGLLLPALNGKGRKPKRYSQGLSKWLWTAGENVRQNFLSSLSVTAATLPVSCWYFYEFPIYGVLLNLLVLPLMPAVMYLGFCILLMPEGIRMSLPAFLLEWLLNLFAWLCHKSLQLPGQTFVRGRPEIWQMILYVALLLAAVWRKAGHGGKWKKWLLLIGAIFLLCFKPRGSVEITFLDVGQGDSICIQTDSGSAYLVDCGSSSRSDVGKNVVASFLKYKGISYLNAVIITHPDTDHCNGLEGLLTAGYEGRIGVLFLPAVDEECKNENYLALEQMAATYGIAVGYLAKGMTWQDGQMTFTCLHPQKDAENAEEPDDGFYADSNAYSVVLHVKTGDFSALLTGDVEGEGEIQLTQTLQEEGIKEIALLKVAHHGSKYSTTEAFLESLDVGVAVISCGEGNWYGHPHAETLERLLKEGAVIWSTPKQGAITLRIKRNGRITLESVRQTN